MTYTVYGFRLIGDKEVRYIGQTSCGPEKRLLDETRHANKMRERSKFADWLHDNEGLIEAFHIQDFGTRAEALVVEKAFIAFCVAIGHRLFNIHGVPGALRIPRREQAAAA